MILFVVVIWSGLLLKYAFSHNPTFTTYKTSSFFILFICIDCNTFFVVNHRSVPKINPLKGLIYIIQTTDGIGYYKIGKTGNLKTRLNSYNGDKKDDIVPIYTYETDNIDAIESCIKSYAKKYKYRRKYKEIYKADIRLRRIIFCNHIRRNINLTKKYCQIAIQKNTLST